MYRINYRFFSKGQDITDEKAVLYYQAIHGLTEKASYVLIAFILIGTILIIVALILTSIVSLFDCSMNNNHFKGKFFFENNSNLNFILF